MYKQHYMIHECSKERGRKMIEGSPCMFVDDEGLNLVATGMN